MSKKAGLRLFKIPLEELTSTHEKTFVKNIFLLSFNHSIQIHLGNVFKKILGYQLLNLSDIVLT